MKNKKITNLKTAQEYIKFLESKVNSLSEDNKELDTLLTEYTKSNIKLSKEVTNLTNELTVTNEYITRFFTGLGSKIADNEIVIRNARKFMSVWKAALESSSHIN